MTKIRGFELVSTYNNQELLPKRETAHAAGYDLKVAEGADGSGNRGGLGKIQP